MLLVLKVVLFDAVHLFISFVKGIRRSPASSEAVKQDAVVESRCRYRPDKRRKTGNRIQLLEQLNYLPEKKRKNGIEWLLDRLQRIGTGRESGRDADADGGFALTREEGWKTFWRCL